LAVDRLWTSREATEAGSDPSYVIFGSFTLGGNGLFPMLQGLEQSQEVAIEWLVSAKVGQVGVQGGPDHGWAVRVLGVVPCGLADGHIGLLWLHRSIVAEGVADAP
jgi:hypothetical protein